MDVWFRHFDWEARKPCSRAQISDYRVDRKVRQHRQRGQGVEHMLGDELSKIVGAREIDPAVPLLKFGEIPLELSELGCRENHTQFGCATFKTLERRRRSHEKGSGG